MDGYKSYRVRYTRTKYHTSLKIKAIITRLKTVIKNQFLRVNGFQIFTAGNAKNVRTANGKEYGTGDSNSRDSMVDNTLASNQIGTNKDDGSHPKIGVLFGN